MMRYGWMLGAVLLLLDPGLAQAQPQPHKSNFVASPARRPARPAEHPRPRLKLSIERFSVNTFDKQSIGLTGARIDVYPLSERWMRGGAAVQGGTGSTAILGNKVNVNFGLLGLTAGIQYPARVTPFIEGHVAGGLLHGRLEGSPVLPAGAGTLGQTSGTTWLYARGINAGSELYTVGRLYVSASVGWVRTTWASPDYRAAIQNPGANLTLTDVTTDSFMWKLGLGI